MTEKIIRKLILCEGISDLVFIRELLKRVKGYKVSKEYWIEIKINKRKNNDENNCHRNLVSIIIKENTRIKIIEVEGIDNIKKFLNTRAKVYIKTGKIKDKDIIIVVDGKDFEERGNSIEKDLSKYKLIKIPTNLEYFLANELKKRNIYKKYIEFWENEWGEKIEDIKNRDIKELFWLFHSILSKNFEDKKEFCINKVIEKICEDLGEENLKEIYQRLFGNIDNEI